MPGLVLVPKSDACRNDVDALNHWQCRPGSTTMPQQLGHLWPSGTAPGGPTVATRRMSATGCRTRCPLGSPAGSSRSTGLLKSLVSTTALSFEQGSRIRRNRAIQMDLRLAHSLSKWMVEIVKHEHYGSGALRNLPVTTMPSIAHVAYFCVQGT